MARQWEGELFPKYLVWRKSPHGATIYSIIESLILRERGKRSHYGMFALINDARFEYRVRTRDDEGFKVNNGFAPYLAREFVYSGVAPEGFLELVGGTPKWFIDWAGSANRLAPQPTVLGASSLGL